MTIIKRVCLAFISCCLSGGVLAEVNYIEVSAGVWGTDMDGGFEIDEIDYTVNTDQFEFETETSSFLLIRVEGENKYTPDVSIGLTSAKHSGPGTIGFSGSAIYVEDGSIDLSHVDLSLYYSVFQNDVVDVNLGLSGKYFYGDFSLEGLSDDAGNTYSEVVESSLETTLPMLFVSVDFQPISAINTYLTIQGGSYDGQKGHDISLGADYIFGNNVGLGLGYRQFETVQSSDTAVASVDVGLELDIKVSGGFFRVFYQQ